MTNPPPPGNWGPPQPPYGQGQPPYGPGQWPPQQGWGPPPAPPKNNLKWLLIGVAVLLVIAISVGVTLLFTRDGNGGTTQTANGNPPPAGEIASANDTGPVTIITEDPTCEAWRPVNESLALVLQDGWVERDFTISVSQWSPEQREMHDEVAVAMRNAAEQTIALAKITPHRAMRELYEQSIAFWRAYANSIPTYTYRDNSLAVTASDTTGAIASICTAIEYRAASARAPITPKGPEPRLLADVGDPAAPEMFLSKSDSSICTRWATASKNFETATEAWRSVDPGLLSGDWSTDQRETMDASAQVMRKFAAELQTLGDQSNNPVLDDFANLSAQYWLAFAEAMPSYNTNDSYLSSAASFAYLTVYNACRAIEPER